MPLAGPLLMSVDAWGYWAMAGSAVVRGRQPIRGQFAVSFPERRGISLHGSDVARGHDGLWPAWTVASEGVAALAGHDATLAAWLFRAAASACMVAVAAIVARISAARRLRRGIRRVEPRSRDAVRRLRS